MEWHFHQLTGPIKPLLHNKIKDLSGIMLIDAIWLYNRIDEHDPTEILKFEGWQDGIAITTKSHDLGVLLNYLQRLPGIIRTNVDQSARAAPSHVIFVDLKTL